jgi:hypothetical protein
MVRICAKCIRKRPSCRMTTGRQQSGDKMPRVRCGPKSSAGFDLRYGQRSPSTGRTTRLEWSSMLNSATGRRCVCTRWITLCCSSRRQGPASFILAHATFGGDGNFFGATKSGILGVMYFGCESYESKVVFISHTILGASPPHHYARALSLSHGEGGPIFFQTKITLPKESYAGPFQVSLRAQRRPRDGALSQLINK